MQFTKSIWKRAFVALASTFVFGGVLASGAGQANARGGSPLIGTSYWGSTRSCFNESLLGVRNSCSTTQSWVMPAVYDAARNMTLSVSAIGVSGTARRVCCNMASVSSAAGALRETGPICTNLHTGVSEWLQGTISAHGWGATVATCAMDPDTRLVSFHY